MFLETERVKKKKKKKKRGSEQALWQLVKESWFLKGSLPGMHVRVAFGCCQWRNPSRAPVNGCCKHSILHHSWARRIFEQRTLSHLFFPPSTLNSLEHKSLREGDLPDKGPLSSLEKETWRRMEGIQVALLFPLALIRHFSVSYWALLRGQTHWIHF